MEIYRRVLKHPVHGCAEVEEQNVMPATSNDQSYKSSSSGNQHPRAVSTGNSQVERIYSFVFRNTCLIETSEKFKADAPFQGIWPLLNGLAA